MSLRSNCDIANTILNSSVLAFESYLKMTSEDCWVSKTPEYWYTVAIAKSLSRTTNYEVLIENSVSEVREYANRGKRGAPRGDYRASGRADIVLWKDDYKPKAIIEIKKGWSWDKNRFGPDLDRITASLLETGKRSKTGGTLKSGFFVVITDTADDDAEMTKKWIDKFSTNLGKNITTYVEKKGKFKVQQDRKFGQYMVGDDEANSRMAVLVFKVKLRK